MNEEIYNVLKSEIKPALGCTGPTSVCFAAAHAYDAIGGEIQKINAKIDFGLGCKIDDVAFPGTKMLGAEMAIALGAVCGDPNAGLLVLHNVTPEGEMKARKVAEVVEIEPLWDRKDRSLYADVTIWTDKGVGRAIMCGRADFIILKERNGMILEQHEQEATSTAGKSPIIQYRIKDFYQMAMETPIEQFDFLKEAINLNDTLAHRTIQEGYGAGIGRTLYSDPNANINSRAQGLAAAGCEARMSGIRFPAMSCANKGNVGIAASLPLISVAKDINAEEEKLLRALALSYTVAIAVIHRIGKSPTMCSCEVASSLGVAAGSVLLHGGTEQQVENAIQNVIPSLFGVVCAGASIACAARIASSAGVALQAADLALAGVRMVNNQGVLDKTADASIEFLGHIALDAMYESDKELAKAMWKKRKVFPLMSFEERQKQ